MDEHRDPFGQALGEIRQRIRMGRQVLGERLMVTELSRELGLSATPIREALSRLAGEGLIEDRRGLGYFAWRLDAVDLVELYDLQLAYLDAAWARALDPSVAALKAANGEAAPIIADGEGVRRLEALFGRVVAEGRSQALARCNRILADRLAAARRVEARAGLAVGTDLAALEQAYALGQGVREAAAAYHALRRQAAPAIIAAMRSAAAGGAQVEVK